MDELKKDHERLVIENIRLSNKITKLESGSRKSALNIHAEGKDNLQRYIDTFYPQLETTGNFLRRTIEQVEPYSYEQIIAGEF